MIERNNCDLENGELRIYDDSLLSFDSRSNEVSGEPEVATSSINKTPDESELQDSLLETWGGGHTFA